MRGSGARRLVRRHWQSTVLLAAVLLGGCVQQPGLSERDEELNRVKVERRGFGIHSVSPTHSVVRAGARNVVIEAVPGFCISEDSFASSQRGAYLALIACNPAGRASLSRNPDGDDAEPVVPPVPGIMSVSVLDTPLFGDFNRPAPLRELRDLLGSAPGQRLLGRGDAGKAEFVESLTLGDVLYVRVRESAPRKSLTASFWRAFLEINQRLTLVTFSAHTGRHSSRAELAQLVRQVVALRIGNGLSAAPEALELVGEAETIPAGEIAIVSDPTVPLPPKRRRPVRLNQSGRQGSGAPALAPSAPARPVS